MRRSVCLFLLCLAAPATVLAQTPPMPTYDQAVTNAWKRVHDKILVMVKDLPEAHFGWKPHPDVRTAAEELRHVVIGLEMTTAMLKGEKFDYQARVKADEGKPNTRAAIVADLEAAIAASYPLVEKQPNPRLVGWLEHQGEHYGKLVNAYRANGLVPPASRPRTGG